MASLYGQYIKERENRDILETEDGFATYSFHNDGKVCYIMDIYVVPAKRKQGVAAALANRISAMAREA